LVFVGPFNYTYSLLFVLLSAVTLVFVGPFNYIYSLLFVLLSAVTIPFGDPYQLIGADDSFNLDTTSSGYG
jgi:hypothetical protein